MWAFCKIFRGILSNLKFKGILKIIRKFLTQRRRERKETEVIYKQSASFMFIFIMIIRKSIVEDAELDNNALFSAPTRALRENS